MCLKPRKKLKMSEKKDYFDYVENILGVKSILLNKESGEISELSTSKTSLLILVDRYGSYTDDEKDLLVKMVSALKIDLKLITIKNFEINMDEASEFTILFLDEINQFHTDDLKKIITHSPRFLLKNPNYKKKTWEDLQKVIQFFKNK